MKDWNLSRLLAAIVLARGGGEEASPRAREASVFAVEWSRVRLDDLPGFPDWMPQLQVIEPPPHPPPPTPHTPFTPLLLPSRYPFRW